MTRVLAGPRWDVKPETLLLLALCLADGLSSAFFFHHRLAVEANPLMRPIAEAGPLPLITVKMLWTLAALIPLERFARVRPEAVRPLMRCGIYLYVGIYGLAVTHQFLG